VESGDGGGFGGGTEATEAEGEIGVVFWVWCRLRLFRRCLLCHAVGVEEWGEAVYMPLWSLGRC